MKCPMTPDDLVAGFILLVITLFCFLYEMAVVWK